MKVNKARKLKAGDKVLMNHEFLPEKGIVGTVADCSDDNLCVEWDTGERSMWSFSDIETKWYVADVEKL